MVSKTNSLHTELCLLKDKWSILNSDDVDARNRVSKESYNFLRKLLLLERQPATGVRYSQAVIQTFGETFVLTREQTITWQHFKRHTLPNPSLCPIRDLTSSLEMSASDEKPSLTR